MGLNTPKMGLNTFFGVETHFGRFETNFEVLRPILDMLRRPKIGLNTHFWVSTPPQTGVETQTNGSQHLCRVRGLYITTGQYSSFCGRAVDLVLGGFDDMEDDVQDRGDEENGQKVETLEREGKIKAKRDNEQSDT